MTASDAKLFVVSNPDGRVEIDAALADSGLGDVHYGDGGDSTLARVGELEPDVIVLCAELDQGDARSLASAIRDRRPNLPIVLIGQATGPIRNALDASDFEVDHFIGQPIAAKALAFAIRSGLAKAREAVGASGPSLVSEPLSDDAIETRARTQSKIGELMDQAIDDFLVEAIAAIPGVIPAPSAADGAEAEMAEAEPGEGGDASGEASLPSDGTPEAVPEALAPDLDTARQAVPTAAHDEPTGKIPGAQLFATKAEIAQPVKITTSAGDDDTTAPADWREETMVLDDTKPRAEIESSSVQGQEVPAGGGFARELRRKMSAMAERLFPDEKSPVDLGVSHSAHTEIDLADLGGGVTNIGIRDDDEWNSNDESTTAGTRIPDDEWSDTGIHNVHLPGKHDVRGEIGKAGNDVASLLSRLFDLGVTGRISFRRSGTEKIIYLDRGRPVFATSNLPHDRMGDLLFREGKLTRQQHVRSRELVAESGRRMGEILVTEGFLKDRELMPAVRRHLADLIYSLFSWTDGEFEIKEDAIPSAEKIRLKRHPAALTVEGIRRKYDMHRLLELLGSDDPVIELTEAERINALSQQIELLPEETRAITHFDGREPLSRVAQIAETDLLSAAQVGFALVAMGAATVVSEAVADAEEMADDDHVEPEASDTAIDKHRIVAKYDQVIEGDYFHLLGVRRDSSKFEIRRAYELAVRDFAPSSFSDELQREMSFELGEILYVLGEAYAVLSDDHIRESYLSNLRV